MYKSLSLSVLMSLFASISYADFYSSDVHRTKIDKTVKNCPTEKRDIAEEVLQLELAGLRWRKSDPKCFESLKMKYIQAVKVPDAHALKMVRVKPDSLKIISVEKNEQYFTEDITFTVVDENGNTVKDKMSFMTNAEWGEKKPQNGCALISPNTDTAYVREDCL